MFSSFKKGEKRNVQWNVKGSGVVECPKCGVSRSTGRRR